MMRNVNPPLAPILLGKPQMLPRPTAEPTAAMRNPNVDPKPFLSSMFSLLKHKFCFRKFLLSRNAPEKGAKIYLCKPKKPPQAYVQSIQDSFLVYN